MELLKTSVVINNMHDECESESERESIDYNADAEMMFHAFATQLTLPLDYTCDVKPLLDKCNVMYKSDIFSEFIQPTITEYFCKHLNYLLLIDFILSFFKIDNPSFEATSISTELIFCFFLQISHVFNFANYLDLDKDFVKYLKSMLTLYLLHLDRSVIELHFKDTVPILDEFFVNEIFKDVYISNMYNSSTYEYAVRNCSQYKEHYAEELKEYDMSAIHIDASYDFLDTLFMSDYYNGTIWVISKRVYSDNDLDNDSDNDSDDSYNYTPRPYTEVKAILETDPMYSPYKKMYILKLYHTYICEVNQCLDTFKRISHNIKISSYNSFYPSPINGIDPCDTRYITLDTIYKIKIILGCNDVNMPALFALDHGYSAYLPTICNYGHIHLFKQAVEQDVDGKHVYIISSYAIQSPNPELCTWLCTQPTYRAYLEECYPTYVVPQIKFN